MNVIFKKYFPLIIGMIIERLKQKRMLLFLNIFNQLFQTETQVIFYVHLYNVKVSNLFF